MRPIASMDGDLTLESVHTAPDGTRKLLSRLGGADSAVGAVETVSPCC